MRFNGPMKKGLLALCTLAAVLSAAAASIDETLERVAALANEDRLAEARRVLGPLLARDADHPRLRLLDGVLRAREGRVREAIEVFDRLRRDHPEMSEPWNNLAVLYAGRGAYRRRSGGPARRPRAPALRHRLCKPRRDQCEARAPRLAARPRARRGGEGGAGSRREPAGRRPRPRGTLPEVRCPAGWPRCRRMLRRPARPTILRRSARRAFAAAGSRTAGCSPASRSGWSRAVPRSSRCGARGTARPTTSRCTFRPSRTVRRPRPRRARSALAAVRDIDVIRSGRLENGISFGVYGVAENTRRRVASLERLGYPVRTRKTGKVVHRYFLEARSTAHPDALRAAWNERFPDWPLESVDCI